MREVSTARVERANVDDDRTDEAKSCYDSPDVQSRGWFADLARPLLGDADPGLVFESLTGIEPRQGQRYGYGETKAVPLYFGVQLLRSGQGEAWLNAYMDGCKVAWWLRHKRLSERADRDAAVLASTQRSLKALVGEIEKLSSRGDSNASTQA